MKKRAATKTKKQELTAKELPLAMRQLVLPMIEGMEVTKTGLLAFVHQTSADANPTIAGAG